MLVLGFGLIYYPWYPEGFRTSTGEIPSGSARFLSALYFSFETLITLGYGDLVPNGTAVRFLSATEGLIGFGLLTASVSSIVLLYPVLARMRLLGRRIGYCVKAQREAGVSIAESGSDVLLVALAEDVTNTRIDLVHFPIAYYFATDDVDASVPRWVLQLVRIAREGLSPNAPPNVRLAAAVLDCALTDFAHHLGERFIDMDSSDREAVFRAVATDHAVHVA
jgi:hypothetical protein